MVKASDLGAVRDVRNVLQDLAEQGADPLRPGRPFRERLDEDNWLALKARSRQIGYSAGSIIFTEGDTGDELYVLLSGRVVVLKEKRDEQSALLAYRGPGDILGEMTVMSRVPRSATVVVVEDAEALCIKGEEFRALTKTVPGICHTMLCVLAERLRAADVARTAVVLEEQHLVKQLQMRTTEAERLTELARLRQQTVDLIVHDLRSPLSVIRGCLDLFDESMSEASRRASEEVLGIARRSTDRLLSLVEALLDAARREGLGVRIDQEPLDLSDMLGAVVDGMRAVARSSGVELVLNVSPDLPQPPGDRSQLERVLGNLVDNAISYTPAEGVVVVAAAARDTGAEVSVTDTGSGIPLEYREHIFDRFSRVPGAQGRRRGFGLGLYFCRQVVQAHGGLIWMESGPQDVGSRFVFTLPQNGTPHP